MGAWHTIWSETTANISSETVNISINNSDLGHQNFQLCWFINGNVNEVVTWSIDDVLLQTTIGNTAIVKGVVSADYPGIPLQEIQVKAGQVSVCPTSDGAYELYLIAGNYDEYMVYHPLIRPESHAPISVTSNQVMEDCDFMTHYLSPVTQINPVYNQNNHHFSLSWSHALPQGSPLSLSHFNVYRQINSGAYEVCQESASLNFEQDIDTTDTYRSLS